MKPVILVLITVLLLFNTPLNAAEKDYQNPFCEELGGQVEVVLSDRTRVDCLTDTYAIEVDFAHKWAEAIGQALHYAVMTGKQPGIMLIIKSSDDIRHAAKIQRIMREWHLPIRVWIWAEGSVPGANT